MATTITGTSGDDFLTGTSGDDSIFGAAGDDYLAGGAGNDTLDGGTNGQYGDVADYSNDPAGVSVNLATCIGLDGFGGTDLVFTEHVNGSAFDDTLVGAGGKNWFRPGAGNDSVDGASGSDVVMYEEASGPVTINLLTGTASGGGMGNDTIANIESAHGGGFADHITLGNASSAGVFGRGGDDTLVGGTSADFFEPGSGDDHIDGGSGSDTLVYDTDDFDTLPPTGQGVSVNMATGTATDSWGDTDTFTRIEAVFGSQYDDTLIGGAANDSLRGNGGNDSMQGGAGQDTMLGGLGDDTLDGGPNDPQLGFDCISFFLSANAVNVNMASGTAAGEGNDVFTNFEGVFGTPFADTLTGDAGDNLLRGNDGSDTLDGGAGNDWVDYAAASAGVTANLATGTSSGANGSDTFTNIERIRGTGFDDSLTGDGGDNVIRGNGGNDTMDGGAGNDALDYYAAFAGVSVNLATGTATGGDNNDTFTNFERIYGSFSFGDTLTGDTAANFLYGRGGADALAGSDGNDTLEGGSGDDTLDGGLGIDTALFTGNFADYTITGDPLNTNRFFVSGPEGNDTLIDVEILQFADRAISVGQVGTDGDDELEGGDEDEVLSGRGGNDRIEARGGNDYLDGGEGDDTMEGGEGDDTYVVDSAGDRVIEPDSLLASPHTGVAAQVSIGGGIDRVVASLDYTAGNAIENLDAAAGAGALRLTGNALPNLLRGNESGNTFTGAAGNDTIDGGDGIDTSVYTGNRAQYSVAVGESVTVTANATNEGSDTLITVERLQFADGRLAVDLDGNAGDVARIIGIIFGPAAVADQGLAALGLQFSDSGIAYEPLMDLALDAVLGADATSGAIVTLLYTNLVGSAPDAGTRDFYAAWIDDSLYTPAGLAVLAADMMGIPAAAQNGLAFA